MLVIKQNPASLGIQVIVLTRFDRPEEQPYSESHQNHSQGNQKIETVHDHLLREKRAF